MSNPDTLSLPDAQDADAQSADVGIEAIYSPGTGIQIYTDSGDTALTELTPESARKLAAWLNAAADKAEAHQEPVA